MRQTARDLAGGWWEDGRGYVVGRALRARYHEACKALRRATKNFEGNENEDWVAGFSLEVDRCTEAVKEVEKEVSSAAFD